MTKSDAKRKPGRPTNPIGRPKLIELARGIFSNEGYAGASLSQIADAAGLRKASLYHHFATKEVLYLAVMDQVIGDLAEFFVAAVSGTGSFVDRLDEAASIAVRYLAYHPDAARILVREMVDGGPFFRAHGAQAIDSTLSVAAQFMEAGMVAGEFKKQDPKQLIFSIAGMCLFSFAANNVAESFLGIEPESDEAIEERTALLLGQIRRLALAD